MKLVANRAPDIVVPETPAGEDPFAAFASETDPPPPPPPPAKPASAASQQWIAALKRLPGTGKRARRVMIVTLSLLLVAAAGVVSVREVRTRWLNAPQTGRLTLNTTPAGAEVIIDGARRGVTPLSLDLATGPHKVTLRSGEATRDLSIETKRGIEIVQGIELAPIARVTTGALSVSSDPPGMRVSVDGVARGTTPAKIDQLSPGAHIVSLLGRNGSTERSVVIQAGGTSTLHVASAAPEVASASGVGSLSISSPIDVELFQGDALIGSSQSARLLLPTGTHRIVAVNEALGFRREITVDVKPGATNRVTVPVPNGALSVNARPWAEVFVNGKSLGETPIGNHALPIGSHELVFKHPELGERRQTVVIAAGRTARVGVDFRQ